MDSFAEVLRHIGEAYSIKEGFLPFSDPLRAGALRTARDYVFDADENVEDTFRSMYPSTKTMTIPPSTPAAIISGSVRRRNCFRGAGK